VSEADRKESLIRTHRRPDVYRFLAVVAILFTGLFIANGLQGQDKKDNKDKAPQVRVLPPNWGGLGLSDEQKQKIYKVQDVYKPKVDDLRKKIEELEKQLSELKTKERAEREQILTEVQKKKLKAINEGKDVPEKKP
jgi:TolA-binding protein